MTTGKTIALTTWTFVGKVTSLLLIHCPGCHSFSSKEQVSFNFMAAVIIHSDFGTQEKKSVTVSIVSPSICYEVMELDAMILGFWMLSLKQLYHSPLSPSLRGSLVPLRFLPWVVSSAFLRLLRFLPPILILAHNSSNPAFLMMCSAYRLNK